MTLAPSNRYKLYQPVVLTTDFPVPFPIFDTDDLEVRVDGEITALFTVTATFDEGRSDDAEIVLNTSVTNVDVEIYGKREPRRDDDYIPNSPNLSDQFQTDIEAVTATQQEQARDFNRGIKLPVEVGVSYEVLGTAAERANLLLGFDDQGDPTVIEGVAGPVGPGGNLVQIYERTLTTSVSSVDAPLTAGYSSWVLMLVNVEMNRFSNATGFLKARLSDDGGTTIDNGNNYNTNIFGDPPVATLTSEAGISPGVGAPSDPGVTYNGTIEIFSADLAAATMMHANLLGHRAGSLFANTIYSAVHQTEAVQDTFRLYAGTPGGSLTFETGSTFKLYGII